MGPFHGLCLFWPFASLGKDWSCPLSSSKQKQYHYKSQLEQIQNANMLARFSLPLKKSLPITMRTKIIPTVLLSAGHLSLMELLWKNDNQLAQLYGFDAGFLAEEGPVFLFLSLNQFCFYSKLLGKEEREIKMRCGLQLVQCHSRAVHR